MDGNRRFAKKLRLETAQGHFKGFNSFHDTLEWCMDLGVKIVTVYAFSIENFKRSEQEVDTLMCLLEKKLMELLEHESLIRKHGVRVKVIGDLSLLRQSTREAAYKVMWETRNESNCILYIACPYTSHEEMKRVHDLISKELDVSEFLYDEAMYVSEPVDILVRTSGEKRLSDFLLWQVSQDCFIHFVNVLWPEFSFWHMLPILLSYQAQHHTQKVL